MRMPSTVSRRFLDAPISRDEVSKAVNLMFSGKAPGSDAIPAEIYKNGGPTLIANLTELFQSMWEQETLHREFRDAKIVHIYKRK